MAEWLKLKGENINKLKSEIVVEGVTEKYECSLGDPGDYHQYTLFVSLEPQKETNSGTCLNGTQWLNSTNQPSDINLFIDSRSKIIQSSS